MQTRSFNQRSSNPNRHDDIELCGLVVGCEQECKSSKVASQTQHDNIELIPSGNETVNTEMIHTQFCSNRNAKQHNSI